MLSGAWLPQLFGSQLNVHVGNSSALLEGEVQNHQDLCYFLALKCDLYTLFVKHLKFIKCLALMGIFFTKKHPPTVYWNLRRSKQTKPGAVSSWQAATEELTKTCKSQFIINN